MPWSLSHRADVRARLVADRHYNRQKVGTKQFVPPGRCCVLYGEKPSGRAFWITSWPFAEYVKHAWPGAWVCSAFRNEGLGVASDLIRAAIAASRSYFGEPPELGMITFIDRSAVKPVVVRGERIWGWTWRKVGFSHVGETAGGLLAMQLLPTDMPKARPAKTDQLALPLIA